MSGLGGQYGDNLALALDFPWKQYRHVMEIGAGSGALTRRILKLNPHLKATLFDEPNVVQRNSVRRHSSALFAVRSAC